MRSNCQRSVSNSDVHNMPIEERICKAMVFISGGSLILLSTYPDMAMALFAFLGLPVYSVESWVDETNSMWSINYFSFSSSMALKFPGFRDGSSRLGVIAA